MSHQSNSVHTKHPMPEVGAVIIGGDFQGMGILRSLGKHGIPTFLLDRGPCIGRFSRYSKRFMKCPDIKQEELFLEFLTNLAGRENLNGWIIYPNDDETVRFLAKYKEQLGKHYQVTTPNWNVVKFAYEKSLTYQLAEKIGIPVPRTLYPESAEEVERLELDIEFPVILKPSVKEPFYSQTRKKAIRVDSHQELLGEFVETERFTGGHQLMIQELIPGGSGHLFSVGSLYKDGELLGRVVARRARQHPMDFGHATTYAEIVDKPELEEMTKKILGAMGYYGLSEVEFMFDPRDGRYKLLEINARPWGWHTLAIAAGVDLPYLLYQDMLGEKVRQNGCAKDIKWIRLVTDIPTAAGEIFRGRMKLGDYRRSWKGKKKFAVWSLTDPLPFIMEILMLPYLWKKRGF